MKNFKYYNTVFITFHEKVHMITSIKEAMTVFALSTIHNSSSYYDKWEEPGIIHEVLKSLYKNITDCDDLSKSFLKCLFIISDEIPIHDEIIELIDLDTFIINLYAYEKTEAFEELVNLRIDRYPDEGIRFLMYLGENEIVSDFPDFKTNLKTKLCKVVFRIFRKYNIRRLINDDAFKQLLEIIVDVASEIEEIGVQIYSFLINEKLFDLFDEGRFTENCEVLLDMVETDENYEEEVRIIQEFVRND